MSTYGSGNVENSFSPNPNLGKNTTVFDPSPIFDPYGIVDGTKTVKSGKALKDLGLEYYTIINGVDGVGDDDGRVNVYRRGPKKDGTDDLLVGYYDGPNKKFVKKTTTTSNSTKKEKDIEKDENLYFSDSKPRKEVYEQARNVLKKSITQIAEDNGEKPPGPKEMDARITKILNGEVIPPDELAQAAAEDLKLDEVKDITAADIAGKGKAYGIGENYSYPLDIQNTKQDRIKFSVLEKKAKNIEQIKANGIGGFGKQQFTDIKGSVTLPIQPVIQDSNRVEWAGMSLNAIESQVAGAAYGLSSQPSARKLIEFAGESLQYGFNLAANNSEIREGLRTYLAQEAAGVQGLLSRTSGAVLNPNMELLFKGPQLRPFSFSFKMSPREQKEATAVRNIIRFFKQNMSVRTTSTNVFLKEPYVFRIQYQTDENKAHPSINQIKECALLDCSVNYTPDGTYMTFNDEERTMTSYSISLQFQEIEPIYNEDYEKSPVSHIGY